MELVDSTWSRRSNFLIPHLRLNSGWHLLLIHSNRVPIKKINYNGISQHGRFFNWAWLLPKKTFHICEFNSEAKYGAKLTELWFRLSVHDMITKLAQICSILLWIWCIIINFLSLSVVPCSIVVSLPIHSGTLKNRTCSPTSSCWWPAGQSFAM